MFNFSLLARHMTHEVSPPKSMTQEQESKIDFEFQIGRASYWIKIISKILMNEKPGQPIRESKALGVAPYTSPESGPQIQITL